MEEVEVVDEFIETTKLPLILYFGGDKSYFEILKAAFNQASSVEVSFQMIDSRSDRDIQSHINRIRKVMPKLVLVDYSQNEKAMLHLSRVCMRKNFLNPISFMGFVDYKQGVSVVQKAILAKINCVHFKSPEVESVVFDMQVMGFPSSLQDHGFATGELNDEISAYYPCKASVVNEDQLQIESNLSLKGHEFNLVNFWSLNKVMSSSLVKCSDERNYNLYYNFLYSQTLELAHVDPVIPTPDMTQEEFDQQNEQRDELIANSKYRMTRWLQNKLPDSSPKFLKALVIDKEGHFYDDKPLSDSYSYVFRIQPFIKNAKYELITTQPQLIIYNIEEVDQEELEANADLSFYYNDTRMLNHLVKTIRSMKLESPPILIVFNSGAHDTAYYQKVLSYPGVLAVKEDMNIDLVLKMTDMLKTKIEPKLPVAQKKDFYIRKDSEYSYCEIESSITLIGCSETDVYFNSKEELKVGTVLRIFLGVSLYITVAPSSERSRIQSQYYAIIHGIGEAQRKEVRRYINEVFFRELEKSKVTESEEIEKIKQKYIESQNAEKLKEEELAREQEQKEQALLLQAAQIVDELKTDD